MHKEIEARIITSIHELEAKYQETIQRVGFNQDLAELKIIIEMLKEQVGYENINSSIG